MTSMLARLTIAALFAALAAAPGRAAEEPQAYACTFTTGVTHVYAGGRFTPEKAAAVSFGIAAIDFQAQTAELKTENGTGALRIARAVNATHFLEIVTEGSLHITTIFDGDSGSATYPAVHSRHFGLLGQPIVSHYQGFCEAKR
jgi:hypothetical protein